MTAIGGTKLIGVVRSSLVGVKISNLVDIEVRWCLTHCAKPKELASFLLEPTMIPIFIIRVLESTQERERMPRKTG